MKRKVDVHRWFWSKGYCQVGSDEIKDEVNQNQDLCGLSEIKALLAGRW